MKKQLFLSFIFIFHSCVERQKTEKIKIVLKDSIEYSNYADSIVYDVIVKNTDPYDTWQNECLAPLHRDSFINQIFQQIYEGTLQAYDVFTNQQLSIDEVKAIENQDNFSKEIVGKYQFNEKWLYNKENNRFIKVINSISFGYENYRGDSTINGYLPLFRIYFN